MKNLFQHHVLKWLFSLAILMTSFTAVAEDIVVIKGAVFDEFMHEPLRDATISVLQLPDSSVIDTCKSDGFTAEVFTGKESEKTYTGEFFIRIPRSTGKCAVRISAAGLCDVIKSVDLDSLDKSEVWVNLGSIYMNPPSRHLGEVEVRASLVKFYNNGDTLVYNADAFKLAQGSMLDALIEQLPGVVLKDNGQIFVNGRYVKALLLNGKEFLGNNNQILLSNLPSYTVKNVKVYDKLGRASELAGTDMGDSEYVMDVKLKKEYMVGLNINAEAGVGTDHRYLGRLFGMGFTPNNQYMAYVNVNNLNDSRKPGQSGSWTPETMPTGVLRTVMGGFDYSIKSKNKQWELRGNANAAHTREEDGTDVIRTNYLADRNTYGYSFMRELNRMLSLTTNHDIYWKPNKKMGLQARPYVDYRTWERSGSSVSATFDREYNNVTASFIEGIYSGQTADVLKTMLNRELSESYSKGHSLDTRLGLSQRISTGSGILNIKLDGDYSNKHETRDHAYDIRFSDAADASHARTQRYKDYPDHSHSVGADVSYIHKIKRGMSVLVGYGFTHRYSKATSMLHYLEGQLYGDDFMAGHLPSAMESLVFDADNSFVSRETDQLHKFNFEFNFDSKHWWLNFRLPVTYAHKELRYDRGSIHARLKKDRFLFNEAYPFLEWRDGRHHVHLSWRLKSIEPSMTSLVDYTDTTNPLYIIHGNPDLKNALQVRTALAYSNSNEDGSPGDAYTGASISYGYLSNGISMVSDYDTATGVRTSRYMNVSGNWDASVSGTVIRQFNNFDFNTGLKFIHVTNVDLIGQNGAAPVRSKVFDNSAEYRLRANATFSKVRLGVDFTGSFNRYTSSRPDFAAQNTWNFKTGLNGVITLPAEFQLSADLTMYNRRGFTDAALNTDNFVLNARLSKSLLKGKLVLMLDGYDILHDLSNVSYTVNAQGRTETYRTVLPRYFMFHVQWRINHTPRRHIPRG